MLIQDTEEEEDVGGRGRSQTILRHNFVLKSCHELWPDSGKWKSIFHLRFCGFLDPGNHLKTNWNILLVVSSLPDSKIKCTEDEMSSAHNRNRKLYYDTNKSATLLLRESRRAEKRRKKFFHKVRLGKLHVLFTILIHLNPIKLFFRLYNEIIVIRWLQSRCRWFVIVYSFFDCTFQCLNCV